MRRLATATGLAALLALPACASLLGIDEPGPTPPDADLGGPDAMPADAAPPDARTEGTVSVVLENYGAAGARVTSEPPGIDCPGDCSETFAVGQQVSLHMTQPSQFSVFGGFRGATCVSGTGDCVFSVADDVSVRARLYSVVNLVFATAGTRVPGELDGVANADAFCQASAAAAGLPGTYVAWLSTTTTAAKNRLAARSGWFRPDGQPFLFKMDDLSTGRVLYPPALDELGQPLPAGAAVVTETTATGAAVAGSHCMDYLSPSVQGLLVTGEPTGGTGRWTAGGVGAACNQPAHYYCFGKDFMSAIAVLQPQGEPVMFVSSGTFAPGNGPAAADALCQAESSAAMLPGGVTIALITSGGKSVQERLADYDFPAGLVLRPDGIPVAAGVEELLAGGPMFASPNVTADASTYLDVDVWTGAVSFDTVSFDCSNWTSSGGLSGTIRHAASSRVDTPAETRACSTAGLHVWCLTTPAFQP
jgi:hypothetical protein